MTMLLEGREQSAALSARLDALADLVELGRGRIEGAALDEARTALTRAGERLRLSGEHTVIALAGATGSGKSSLFNAIAGIDLSPVGVRRPTTGAAHACVWGLEGSGALLTWLGIEKRHRYARATALDADVGSPVEGLILLDLPDHDSTVERHRVEVDRLVTVADLVVWVVDPQKYADAAVHERYLRPSISHQAVIAVVLNQVDVLGSEDLQECAADLRQLLAGEGLTEPHLLMTSVREGTGLPELRSLIGETVMRRHAALERLEADFDQVTRELSPYVGATPIELDPARCSAIVVGLQEAAGVAAAAQTVEHMYWQHGLRRVEWAFVRLARGLGGDPLRRVRLGPELRRELRVAPGQAQPAQSALVDSALDGITEAVTEHPPQPWLDAVTEAGWSRSEEVPAALGAEVAAVVAEPLRRPVWWWAAAVFQWALAACVLAGIVWSAAVLAFGYVDAGSGWVPLTPGLLWLLTAEMLPYALVVAVGALLLGLAIARLSRRGVARGASVCREDVRARATHRIELSVDHLVFAPMREELHRYAQFCHQFRIFHDSREDAGELESMGH